jgi:tRNA(fMet)-specific endonuclease VapC
MTPGRVVVDTSVVSYLLKDHSQAPWYANLLRGRLVGLSFMTLAELYRWPLERDWGETRFLELREHLVRYIVLFPDDTTCREWARIMARKGKPIEVDDAWIAATAVQHRCPLVTHNPRHFQNIGGLEVLTAPA